MGDLGALLRFRAAGLRGRARRVASVGLGVIAALTLLAAVVPAYLPAQRLSRPEVLAALPAMLLGVLAVATASAAASGGGRELLARDHAVAFPVSPVTDHLGALVMAPLNIAWLAQAWLVLGATSYVVTDRLALVPADLLVLLWLVLATVVAQAVAWGLEWVRRGPAGTLLVRLLGVVVAAGVAALVLSHRLDAALDRSPTRPVGRGVEDVAAGRWSAYLTLVAVLVAVTAAALLAGARGARRLTRRPVREELRAETARHAPRREPGSDLLALVRLDRAGIWRSVPLRRGMAVLALLPGVVAIGGSFRWDSLGILPGLVAAGGALLFGVNAWCLDGRGALWRDSLPVRPGVAFASRVVVLTEILLVSIGVTLLLAGLRAGTPTTGQAAAAGCAAIVVTLQVVATALRWAVRTPYAVDLRSARATPAPPLVMVGYSARLALSTTFTGMLFDTAGAIRWWAPLLLAVPFLLWSGTKLARTSRAWEDPPTRARVVATVAG